VRRRGQQGREGEGEGREGEGRVGRCVRTDAHVRVDAKLCPRGRECSTPGNFQKDATVRPSHGRPRGHRPTVHPSVRPSARSKSSV
jgi:hypothetical protein